MRVDVESPEAKRELGKQVRGRKECRRFVSDIKWPWGVYAEGLLVHKASKDTTLRRKCEAYGHVRGEYGSMEQ